MVCDDILYQVDHTLSKTMIARTETRTPARTVWLGLAVDDSLTDLENISFYLDFPNLTESYEYLFLLPCTEWSAGGTPIRMEPGIYEKSRLPEEYDVLSDYDVMSVIDKEVMELYNKHFLRVSQPVPLNEVDKEPLPKALSSCFGERVREKMQEKLVWVKIVFPARNGMEGVGLVIQQVQQIAEQFLGGAGVKTLAASLADGIGAVTLRGAGYRILEFMIALSVRVLHAVHGQQGLVIAGTQGNHPERVFEGGASARQALWNRPAWICRHTPPPIWTRRHSRLSVPPTAGSKPPRTGN